MTATHTIEVDEWLAHPAQEVWEALVDPRRLAAWFMANDFVAEVGHRFTLDTGEWGATHCEVLAVEPGRLLRFSWRNGPLDTEVTWRLEPEGTGTRLFVEHRGFDPDAPVQRRAHDGMSQGWRTAVLAELRRHLDAARA